jgi:hypothetical protein
VAEQAIYTTLDDPSATVVDLLFDAGDDLIGEGLAAVLTEGKGEHADSRLAELARSAD